jgi:hypothetical protein
MLKLSETYSPTPRANIFINISKPKIAVKI